MRLAQGCCLRAAARRLDALGGRRPKVDVLAGPVADLQIEAEDVVRKVGVATAKSARRPGRGALESVKSRLALLERLDGKYGGTLTGRARPRRARPRARRAQRWAWRSPRAGHTRRVSAREPRSTSRSRRCVAARAAAPALARAVGEQLASLAMPNATFEVRLAPARDGSERGGGRRVPDRLRPGRRAAGRLARDGLRRRALAHHARAHRRRRWRRLRGAQRTWRAARPRAEADGSNFGPDGSKPGVAVPGGSGQARLVSTRSMPGSAAHRARCRRSACVVAQARQVLCIPPLQIASLADRHSRSSRTMAQAEAAPRPSAWQESRWSRSCTDARRRPTATPRPRLPASCSRPHERKAAPFRGRRRLDSPGQAS